MTNRETNVVNGGQTQASSIFGGSDLTLDVDSTGDMPASPCYVAINPDIDALREIVYFDGTFTATSMTTSDIGNRYLAGSAAASGLTHPVGSKVVVSAGLAQLWQDINDRVEGHAHTGGTAGTQVDHGALGGLSDAADHPQFSLLTGTRAFTGEVQGVTPVTAQGLVTKALLDLVFPICTPVPWMSSGTIPARFVELDGQAISRTTYADAFAEWGEQHGAGDGSTTFNVPDARDKFFVGAGSTYTLGDTGGAASVTLTVAELPSHNHGGTTGSDAHEHTYDGSVSDGVSGEETRMRSGSESTGRFDNATGAIDEDSHDHTIPSAGSGDAHENRPPYLAVRWMARVL